ncbi:hypothetical protein GCM10023336_74580 [Streptomyces similanensis]|uniref:Uncharacterized protein n=1 Tax=Streptomyces similanensis TaxID=1274988 RepID=A0ABP9LMR4_9ACTN
MKCVSPEPPEVPPEPHAASVSDATALTAASRTARGRTRVVRVRCGRDVRFARFEHWGARLTTLM